MDDSYKLIVQNIAPPSLFRDSRVKLKQTNKVLKNYF